MRSPRLLNVCVSIILILAGAQNIVAQEVAWKRVVAREIELNERTKDRMRPKDSTLVDMLVKAVRTGNITAYTSADQKFGRPMSAEELNWVCRDYPDTAILIDPVTGNEVMKVIKHDIEVYKYRLLEEWTFDRKSGTTTIKTIGIAPLLDVSGDFFNAVKVLFWLKYPEAASTIVRHGRKHPAYALPALIWKDYFSNSAAEKQPPVANTWKKRNVRILDIDPEDTSKRHLKDMGSDTSFCNIINSGVNNGRINIYDSAGNSVSINSRDIYKQDTIVVTDPVTGQNTIRVSKPDPFGEYKPKYKINEDWSFDELRGNTQVKLTHIAPFVTHTDVDRNVTYNEDIFWVKFEDISGILARYEHSHYNNSLANLLWNDYFLSAVETKKK